MVSHGDCERKYPLLAELIIALEPDNGPNNGLRAAHIRLF